MLFWLWHYLSIKIDIYQVHNELCILKSSKNSSICTTLKIQDARLLRVCTACVQIRISQVHGYSECTVIREVRVLCLSIVRSDTGGQTSQTEVKLEGRDPREVRGHSEVKPDLYRQFEQVCVFSASTVVYQ